MQVEARMFGVNVLAASLLVGAHVAARRPGWLAQLVPVLVLIGATCAFDLD